MSFPFDTNDMLFPGLDSTLETVQNQFWWGRNEQQTYLPATILSSALDAGNTVTTVLRGGLLLGRVTASGKFKEWNPTGTDGSEVLVGVLPAPLSMLDAGTGADRYTYVMVGGNLLSDRLLVPGNATEGIVGDAQEFNIVNQLVDRHFKLDRHIQYGSPLTYRPRLMTAAEVAADAVTVLTSDHGRTFYFAAADAATAVTLPEPQVGLTFTFVNPVAQTITLDMTTGKFLTPGANTQDTIALTVGENARIVGVSTALYYAEITEAATD
jgi:hypothetical protein